MHLRQAAPAVAKAAAVVKRLNLLFRRESNESLTDVLAAADETLLAGFADSLRKDHDAVSAALDLPWTTSPAEGQINRLKMIKRTMFGRANLDCSVIVSERQPDAIRNSSTAFSGDPASTKSEEEPNSGPLCR